MVKIVASDRPLSFRVSQISQDRKFRSRLRKVLQGKMRVIFGFSVFAETT